MNMNKFSDKMKEGLSVKEIEDFTRKHTTEVFTVLAIVIATASSCWGFFTGPKLAVFFTGLGCVITVLFPVPIERVLKQLYSFTLKQEKTTQMILGAVKIVIALFIPFILFGFLGLLAGGSYHYYVRHAQIISDNKPRKNMRSGDSGEHD
jgi:uncharacterized membrane protein